MILHRFLLRWSYFVGLISYLISPLIIIGQTTDEPEKTGFYFIPLLVLGQVQKRIHLLERNGRFTRISKQSPGQERLKELKSNRSENETQIINDILGSRGRVGCYKKHGCKTSENLHPGEVEEETEENKDQARAVRQVYYCY